MSILSAGVSKAKVGADIRAFSVHTGGRHYSVRSASRIEAIPAGEPQ